MGQPDTDAKARRAATSRRFPDKTVLVTGGAAGIGLACVKRLLDEGAQVLIADADPKGKSIAAGLGERARFAPCNVTRAEDWATVITAVGDWTGRLDALVNNAGITASGKDYDVLNVSPAHIEHVMRVNLIGAWLGVQTCLPMLIESCGAIVNISSRAGIFAVPSAPAYAASKAALISLTKSAALYCAQQKTAVRCNAVMPGSVNTPTWRPISGPASSVSLQKEGERKAGTPTDANFDHIPLARLARPDEIASAAVFLASEDASYITGTTLLVDGGQSCL